MFSHVLFSYMQMTLLYVHLKIQSSLQSEFYLVQKCLDNSLILNKQKSGSLLFGTRYNLNYSSAELAIYLTDGCPLNKVDAFKYLGLWIDSEFSFRPFRICLK